MAHQKTKLKNEKNMSSIHYYNKNAHDFYLRTIDEIHRSKERIQFLAELQPGATILDVGCGVGRDARCFEKLGYSVTAFDGSEEMVKLSTQILKNPPFLMRFKEMNFFEKFNGVWAAASLIHVSPHELKDIFQRIYNALTPQGIFFVNFKHGVGNYTHEERTFYYMTEQEIRPYLASHFEIINIWKTEDNTSKVAPSPDKMWLHVLAKKA